MQIGGAVEGVGAFVGAGVKPRGAGQGVGAFAGVGGVAELDAGAGVVEGGRAEVQVAAGVHGAGGVVDFECAVDHV